MSGEPLVLVVEDEPAQVQILCYNIEAEGFRAISASDGEEALLLAREHEPDLVLLDWMLPGVPGIEVCRRLKAQPATRAIPVIMLSARSEEADRVRGLETGADDYLVKPFSLAELMARIRLQLRRTRPAALGQRLEFGDIVLDGDAHRVTRAGRALHLGPTEFRLLAALMEKPGRVWSREHLLDRVWGRDVSHDSRTVDVHVARLRKALCHDGGTDPLRTVRGSGYALG
jgi:two-component system phosphate regulon response regulator PhoB